MSLSGPGIYQNRTETMDGLPKQFVSSLRILFDILDENRTGFVRLKDIESRWSDDGIRGLPAGVVDGLRRVTPQDGLLSFERFVAGLKLVLNMRRGNEPRRPFVSKENRAPFYDQKIQGHGDSHSREPPQYGGESHSRYIAPRPGVNNSNFYDTSQEPTFTVSQKKNDQQHNNDSQTYAGKMRGIDTNLSGQNANRSLEESPRERETNFNAYAIKADVRNYPTNIGSHQSPSRQGPATVYSSVRGFPRNSHQQEKPPALPPRTHVKKSQAVTHNLPSQMRKSHSGPDLHHSHTPPAVPPRVHRPNSHILVDLKNWQKEWTANQSAAGDPEQWHSKSQQSMHPDKYDCHTVYANIEQFQRKSEDPLKQQIQQKATVKRHGSGRRHTLSSGIDQNMLKRMKQLEEEKAILQSGLAMVDTARDWYLKQLSLVNDRQTMLGKVSYNDNSLEAHQERMSFQRARVAEVNQQLAALVDSSEKGFPLHMNLAMTSQLSVGDNEKTLIKRNRKLMEEMNHRTNQITQLEKEKATLIRELFEARSKNKHSHDDTTFM